MIPQPHAPPRLFSGLGRSSFLPSDSRNRAASPTSRLTTMASLHPLPAIPRFLLTRGSPALRPQSRVLQLRALRHASSASRGLSEEFRRRAAAQQKKATPVIPQPDKYRPPSHSKRMPNRDLENKVYGPPISEEDKKRMATKKYPNMMSPEGTFSHWFLHNRGIHAWITLVRNAPPPQTHTD